MDQHFDKQKRGDICPHQTEPRVTKTWALFQTWMRTLREIPEQTTLNKDWDTSFIRVVCRQSSISEETLIQNVVFQHQRGSQCSQQGGGNDQGMTGYSLIPSPHQPKNTVAWLLAPTWSGGCSLWDLCKMDMSGLVQLTLSNTTQLGSPRNAQPSIRAAKLTDVSTVVWSRLQIKQLLSVLQPHSLRTGRGRARYLAYMQSGSTITGMVQYVPNNNSTMGSASQTGS